MRKIEDEYERELAQIEAEYDRELGESDDPSAANARFEEKFEAEVLESPIQLTFLGRDERQGEIDDFSEAALDAQLARTRANATLSSERETRGAELQGIDIAAERERTSLARYRVDGNWPAPSSTNEVLIGAALVEDLETRLGKRIVLMSQDPDNEVADRGFRVVGLFEANLEAQEEMFVFAGRATVQRMLRIGDEVSEIAAVGDDYRVVHQNADDD